MRKTRNYVDSAVYSLSCTELMQKLELEGAFVALSVDLVNDVVNIVVAKDDKTVTKITREMQYL